MHEMVRPGSYKAGECDAVGGVQDGGRRARLAREAERLNERRLCGRGQLTAVIADP